MRLLVTPLAEQDLEEIGDYIALDNPARAATFVEELLAQCRKICASSDAYRLRPELARGLRSCAHGNYVIFFEQAVAHITIVRILHGARDIPAAFDQP